MRIDLYIRRRWDDEGAGEGCLFILLDMLLTYHVIYYSCIPLSPGLKVGLEELQDSAVLPLLSPRTLRTMVDGDDDGLAVEDGRVAARFRVIMWIRICIEITKTPRDRVKCIVYHLSCALCVLHCFRILPEIC